MFELSVVPGFPLLSQIVAILLLVALLRKRKAQTLEAVLPWVCYCIGALTVWSLVSNLMVSEINDDVIFYLADGWESLNGGSKGTLPMRHFVFAILAFLGSTPAAVVGLSQALLGLLLSLEAALCYKAARVLKCSKSFAVVGASAAVLWSINFGETVFLRPDSFTMSLALSGTVALLVPSEKFESPLRLALAAFFATLAATMGPRHWLFPLAAILCVRQSYQGKNAYVWFTVGASLALLPSLLYIALADSFSNVMTMTFVKTPLNKHVALSAMHFPLVIFLPAAWGVWRTLCGNEKVSQNDRNLAVMWLASLANVAALQPFAPFDYILVTWIAISCIIIAKDLSGMSEIYWKYKLLFLPILILPMLWGAHGVAKGPSTLRRHYQERQGHLALLNWLDEVSQGQTVACVSPCLPIREKNAWNLYNAWMYTAWATPESQKEISPHFFDFLDSRPSVVQWDAWPQASDSLNILDYARKKSFAGQDEVTETTRKLQADYVLVTFKGWRGPRRYGDGHFLVRKGIRLDERVEVLDSALISADQTFGSSKD